MTIGKKSKSVMKTCNFFSKVSKVVMQLKVSKKLLTSVADCTSLNRDISFLSALYVLKVILLLYELHSDF